MSGHDTASPADPWQGFPIPVLRLTQGETYLALPVYRDMLSPEGLVSMAKYMDLKLLEAVGYVLPSRTWRVTNDPRGS